MKDGNLQSLGALETKLLYTLHWILLDAAEECADTEYEKDLYHFSHFHYLFSIPTITVRLQKHFHLISNGVIHHTFAAVRLLVCAALQQPQRVGLSKFSFGKWSEDMAADVGVSSSRSVVLHFALQTEAEVFSWEKCQMESAV